MSLIIIFTILFSLFSNILLVDPIKGNNLNVGYVENHLNKLKNGTYVFEDYINEGIYIDFYSKISKNNFLKEDGFWSILKKILNIDSDYYVYATDKQIICDSKYSSTFLWTKRNMLTTYDKLYSYYDEEVHAIDYPRMDGLSEEEINEKVDKARQRHDEEYYITLLQSYINSRGIKYAEVYKNIEAKNKIESIPIEMFEALIDGVKINNKEYTYAFFVVNPGPFYNNNQTVSFKKLNVWSGEIEHVYSYKHIYNFYIFMCSIEKEAKDKKPVCSRYNPYKDNYGIDDILIDSGSLIIKGNNFNCMLNGFESIK